MAKLSSIQGAEILEYLYAQGVIEDLVDRVIIDIQIGELVRVYVQRFTKDDFISVLMGEKLMEILKESTNESKTNKVT